MNFSFFSLEQKTNEFFLDFSLLFKVVEESTRFDRRVSSLLPLFDHPPREITHVCCLFSIIIYQLVLVLLLLLLLLLLQIIITTSNHETKESTSAARGEREDGFEGREKRTFGVVFEDS